MSNTSVGVMIDRIDCELSRNNSEGAMFNKTVFHVHTPASYDYGLFKKNDIESITDDVLLETMILEGIPLVNEINVIESLLEVDKNKIFSTGKELALYSLMANKLSKEAIKSVLVTDHNTLAGVEKLIEAFSLNKKHLNNSFPKVFFGVEISCSDKHHVVVILDDRNNKDMVKMAQHWLEKYIISKEGTYLPSLMVINQFINMGAIAYIAHFNTSNMFDEPKFLNGTYKKELFANPEMKFIGLSNLCKKDWVMERIKPAYTDRDFRFILDEDSHTLDELGKRYFWIKGQKLNFDTLKFAFNDFDNSISFEQVIAPKSYIKGLYLEGKTFLKSREKKGIVFTFSKRMNCFIGGRGSGKSTVLNTLEFLVSQLIESENIFDSVLPQGDMCVLCEYEGKDYYISSLNSTKENNQIFKNDYFEKNGRYLDFEFKTEEKRRKEILERIQVWKKDNNKIVEVTKRKSILDAIFTRKFSITNLVNSAQDDESINHFIKNMIQGDKILRNEIIINPQNNWDSIINSINNIQKKNVTQRDKILPQLEKYNSKQEGILRLNYVQKDASDFYFCWKDIIFATKANLNKSFYGFSVTYGSLLEYLNDISAEIGCFEVIKILYERNLLLLEEKVHLKTYQMKNRKRIFEEELKELENQSEIEDLFNKIRSLLAKGSQAIISELKRYYSESATWSLEFNIFNRTGSEKRNPEYKQIYKLSMGQKVVTMLNFILSFSKFTDDYSPLIIDQPEDNLDNQYVYNNLVKIFRDLKSSRQIIIASHNSTIVVNSSAEQVFVMDSDANHGWVERSGFCKEPKILIDIVNKLEGGMTAFEKKRWLYSNILR